MSFLHLPQEAEIHTIPKRSEKWIAMTRKKMEKTEAFHLLFIIYYSFI